MIFANTISENTTLQSVITICGMNTLGERIAHYRGLRNLSQKALALACGWASQSRVGNYEKNLREPGLDDLEKLSSVLGVTIAALLGEKEKAESGGNAQVVAPAERSYRYPVLSSVSAGLWGDAVQPFEPGAEDQHVVSDYMGKGPCFWLRVDGDSMTAPYGESFPEGSMVLVDTGIEPRPGLLVIAKLVNDDKANFKQLVRDSGKSYLKPLNPSYPLIEINGNCRLVGVVVEARRRLI